MLNKLTNWLAEFKPLFQTLQDLAEVRGGLYVDIFGVVIVVRLWAVLKGFPPLTAYEAAVWATTVGSLAYSNTQGPKQS